MINTVLAVIISVQPYAADPAPKNSDCICVSLGHGWWAYDDVPGSEYPCESKGQYWKVEREGERK